MHAWLCSLFDRRPLAGSHLASVLARRSGHLANRRQTMQQIKRASEQKHRVQVRLTRERCAGTRHPCPCVMLTRGAAPGRVPSCPQKARSVARSESSGGGLSGAASGNSGDHAMQRSVSYAAGDAGTRRTRRKKRASVTLQLPPSLASGASGNDASNDASGSGGVSVPLPEPSPTTTLALNLNHDAWAMGQTMRNIQRERELR